MLVKLIQDETFQDYKQIGMLISACLCDWKCCIEARIDITVCQNSEIYKMPTVSIENRKIVERYLKNKTNHAVIFGGLEPMLQFEDILDIISKLREAGCEDPVVIYTGYKESEVKHYISKLKKFKNIIVKFGRYKPNKEPRFDPILGVTLASSNQYAKQIS